MQTNHAKRPRSLGSLRILEREDRRKHSALIRTLSLFTAFLLVVGMLGFMQNGSVLAASSLLKDGSVGSEVKVVQNMLVALDYLNQSDGAFGPITEKAVISFQKDYDLEADGIVGPATLRELDAAPQSRPCRRSSVPRVICMIRWMVFSARRPRLPSSTCNRPAAWMTTASWGPPR